MKNNISNELTKEFQILQSSPLFHFSLGSKELFHSNFLEWIFKNFPKESGRFFSQFLKNKNGNTTIKKVQREFKNRDIVLEFENEQILVIENKVKSIPYKEQLENYSKAPQHNENFLLLTLVMPLFSKRDVITTSKAEWKVINYFELSKLINTINSSIKDHYKKNIINDYICFITALNNIFGNVETKKNDQFTFFSDETDPLLKELRKIRMTDIYLKLKYQTLARIIYEEIGRKISNINGRIFWEEKEESVDSIYISQNMTRGMGIADIVYVLGEKEKFLFQIQGNTYKHILILPGKLLENERIARKLEKKRLWFDFSHMPKHLETRPKRKNREFLKYSNHPWKGVDLDHQFTVRQVVGFIIRDIGRILKNKQEIERVIKVG